MVFLQRIVAGKMYFSETQRFRQPWIWAVLVLGTGAGIASGLKHLHAGYKVPAQTAAALVGVVIPILLILFFLAMRLDTSIDEEGIGYRFVPFHGTRRTIPWNEIAEVYVRQYSPLKEYGGWGIRNSMGKAGMAFNVRGDMGIQLVLKNGRKILLGTQKPEEVKQVLQQLKKA
jgi:hypothetical protein